MRRPWRVALTISWALLAVPLPALIEGTQTTGAGAWAAQRSPAAARTAVRKKTRATAKKTRAPVQKKIVKPAVAKKSTPAWHFTRSLGTPTLAYGVESNDEILLSFSCQPDTGLLRVLSQFGSRGLRPGDSAAIRLANGKLRFEIAGTAFSTEARKDVDIGGATRIDPKLFALFRGDTLVIDVPGRTRSVPMANASASTEAFQKACLTDTVGKPAPTG